MGKGHVYITQKKVPPKTIANEGTSINGPTPPPETIAYMINPSAPINPRREAISIVFPFCSLVLLPAMNEHCNYNTKNSYYKFKLEVIFLASNLFSNIIDSQTNTRERIKC